MILLALAYRICPFPKQKTMIPVSYTHLRAHETKAKLVCRLLLEKKKGKQAYSWLSELQVYLSFFFLMIRRPPRSTPLYSSAASDVYKRQNLSLSKAENND